MALKLLSLATWEVLNSFMMSPNWCNFITTECFYLYIRMPTLSKGGNTAVGWQHSKMSLQRKPPPAVAGYNTNVYMILFPPLDSEHSEITWREWAHCFPETHWKRKLLYSLSKNIQGSLGGNLKANELREILCLWDVAIWPLVNLQNLVSNRAVGMMADDEFHWQSFPGMCS